MSSTTNEYAEFEAYDWAGDEEFQAGLNSILQSSPEGIDKESLKLQAQCFFWYKKTTQQISFEDYNNYLAGKNGAPESQPQQTSVQAPQQAQDEAQAPSENPPYPRSFAEIVELIQSGKPIPGIKQIPNKLNEEKPSEATREKRRKPWEVAAEKQAASPAE
ncbi:hypothetical protein BJ508DRAFT_412483 [Ascobolus immersus RN42]|uniref:Uncharacterized protein n=1 Tax=Ascobolus immersus RN42 TaxID=1160509 RepID=A0A3N4IKR8_ASCIM|nr:hypothetical protein BJ508DRAFT_412483 [Ascobolus immersus RN42]